MSERYAHLSDEEFTRSVGEAAHLCEVALRPTSIDHYSAEKLGQAAGYIERARAILSRNMESS